MDQNAIGTAIGDIQSVEDASQNQLPFVLISNPNKQPTRLLANSGEVAPIEGQSRWFSYEFKEPICLLRLTVEAPDYPDYRQFDIECHRFDGTKKLFTAYSDGSNLDVDILDVCVSISFKPPKLLLTRGKINCVKLFGFALSESNVFLDQILKIESVKADAIADIEGQYASLQAKAVEVEELRNQREIITQQISELKGQATRENTRIKTLIIKRDEFKVLTLGIEQSLSINAQKLNDSNLEIKRESEVRSNLASSIIVKKSNLKTLKENINLFPSELSSFVAQGSKDSRQYFYLALLPIIVITAMFLVLISGAVELSAVFTEKPNINIAALMASRIPYVAVASSIITICYYLARMFVLEMVRVNRQRLNLTKISIVAKDISFALEQGLDLSDDEKYERRLRLKMDLMRNHLEDYISKDFNPSLPESIAVPDMRGPKESKD